MNRAWDSAASQTTENEIVPSAARAGFKFPFRTFFGPCGKPDDET
jgi:hypothetical protein